MPVLQDLEVEFVSLVDRAAVRDPSNPTEAQRFLLWKSEQGNAITDPAEGGTMTEAEFTAALQKAEQERDEAMANLAKAEKKLKKASKEDPETEEINKEALPPEVRKRLEKLEKAEQDANERLAKAEEIAKAERDERITREFVTKAETQFAFVGGDASEFGPLLKRASESLSKEDFEALESRLRATNEQVRTSSLFKELGRGGDPTPGSDDITKADAAARKADELRKADPNLTSYEAMRLAMSREEQAAYLSTVRY